MPTIFIRDELRAAVEAATGGLCTVFYTQSGQPSYFRWIPKFNLQDIDPSYGTGVHPAFIVDGVERDGIWIGMYPGIIKNGELLSLPGVDPTTSRTFGDFYSAARACGPGFHMMTNAERAAVALITLKSGYEPRGNTNWGRSHAAPWETGRRVDSGTPGSATGTGRTLTGSGPLSWRHDGTPAGIADLVGNVWEWVSGVRLVDGEVQVLANNNAATAAAWDNSAAWQAIRLSDGALVATGTAGTMKYDGTTASGDNAGADNLGAPQIDDTIDFRSGTAGQDFYTDYYSTSFQSLAADTGITVPPIAKALLLAPGVLSASGVFWIRNHGTRYFFCGGNWRDGVDAGLFFLGAVSSASNYDAYIGCRPAKV